MSVRQWEYRVEDFDEGATYALISGRPSLKNRLNELGLLGWELVSAQKEGMVTRVVLKKPKGEEPEALSARSER